MSKDNLINLKDYKKEQERKSWEETLDEFEQKTDAYVSDHILDHIEQVGHKNLKNFIKKLRQKHCEDNDDNQKI
jgi:hypothetical protein